MATTTAMGGGGAKAIGDMSPEEWAAYLQKQNTINDRLNQLNQSRSNYSSSASSSSSSLGNNGLFGSLGSFGDLTDQAKDLARFRLGLDQEQARFSRNLREEESQADFGRNFKLADQQITGQKDLTNIQQNATTDRLQRQLSSQQLMQQRGFDQQNLFRAQSAALALRGLR